MVLNAIAAPKAVVVGAMNMDVLAVAAQPAIAGDSTPGGASFYAGGVGRNIAEGLTRLSVNTKLFSVVGKDTTGDRLLAQSRELGIDCDHVRVLSQPTSSYVAIHDVDGGLISAVNSMSIVESLEFDQLTSLPECLNCADIGVVDANLSNTFFNELGEMDFSCRLVADAVSVAKCQRLLPLLARLTLLKVNRAEAEALTGNHCDDTDEQLLERLLQLGCKQILMTLGKGGSIMADGQLIVRADAAPIESIQTVNGAGDSMLAGVIAALLMDLDINEQLRWGSIAAALSLQTTEACSPLLNLKRLQNEN